MNTTPFLGLPLSTHGVMASDNSLRTGFGIIDQFCQSISVNSGAYANHVVMSQVPGWAPGTTALQATSNTAALDLALETLRANGGTIVFDRAGTYRHNMIQKTGWTAPIKFYAAVPGVDLLNTDVDHTANRGSIELTAVIGTSTTVLDSVAAGATQIRVANPAVFAVGQMIELRATNEIWNGIAGVSGYLPVNKNELNYVNGITGDIITLAWPLLDSYTTAGSTINVTPYTPMRDLWFENFTFVGAEDQAVLDNGQGSVGLRLNWFDRVRLVNMNSRGFQNAAGRFNGMNVFVDSGDITGRQSVIPSVGYYGWVADMVYNMRVRDVSGRRMRRVADTGTTRIPRFIEQSGLYGCDLNGSVAGTHHAQFAVVHSCFAERSPNLIVMRARDSYTHHNIGRRITQTALSLGTFDAAGTITNSTLGVCRATDNDAECTGVTGLAVNQSYDSLELLNNRITASGANGAGVINVRAQQRRRTTIDGNTLQANSIVAGYNGIVFDNVNSSATVDEDLNVGVNNFINIADRLIRHNGITGGQVRRAHFARQRSDRLERMDTMYLFTPLSSFEQTTMQVEFDAIGEAAQSGTKNLLINHTMRVDQRNSGASLDVTNSAAYTIDRWRVHAGTQTMRVQRVTPASPPGDSTLALQVQTRNSPAAPAAAARYIVEQILDGQQIAHLRWGTASAKPLLVGWAVRPGSVSGGNIALSVQNGARNRSYVVPLALGNAGTWSFIYGLIPGDTTGTWPTDNTAALRFILDYGSGSNFVTASPSTWVAGDVTRTASNIELCNQNQNNNYQFTLPALIQGTQVPSFERRPHQEEEALCSFYFQRLPVFVGATGTPTTLPIIMRDVPVVTGGGAGFATTGSTGRGLICSQTTGAVQTLSLDAELT